MIRCYRCGIATTLRECPFCAEDVARERARQRIEANLLFDRKARWLGALGRALAKAFENPPCDHDDCRAHPMMAQACMDERRCSHGLIPSIDVECAPRAR